MSTGDCMTMLDLRQHYASGGKLASRSFIYALEAQGELPPSVLLGGKRVWSRHAVLERDAARFRKAEERAAASGKAA
ncbi:putative DNA-binding transcriptional regulator AlpA [Bradyrhizobium sp. F1.13.3]